MVPEAMLLLPALPLRRNMRRLVAILLACCLVGRCSTQGLEPNNNAMAGATSMGRELQAVYRSSVAWRRAYASSPASACSKASGSLCSSHGLTPFDEARLLMATSPQSFDARVMGSFSAVGPVKDQGGCNACVAFVTLAAAQSAVACALQEDAASRLSEQDFFVCRAVEPGQERTCSSAWSVEQAVQWWSRLTEAGSYPVLERCMPYDPHSFKCSYDCRDTDPVLRKGTFKWVQLQSGWEVQEHIRRWGSVITRLEVWSDLKPFFERDPRGVYPGPAGKGAVIKDHHAIQLVGYDLEKGHYLAKNSWGTGFADSGFFRVAFGVAGVGHPYDTYGLKFVLKDPTSSPMMARLTPSKARPGCNEYRARPYDYVSLVASELGVGIQHLLLDNALVIQEPDMRLAGLTLVVCGAAAAPPAPAAPAPAVKGPARPAPRPGGGGGGGGGPARREGPRGPAAAPPPAAAQELDALMAIKTAIDKNGVLATWSRAAGRDGGYCRWEGIKCDKDRRVTDISPDGNLGGVLPDVASLQALPRLRVLGLGDNGLDGLVPEDWSTLGQLRELYLNGNALSSRLPKSWAAGMAQLQLLTMASNQLTGPLPDEWGAFASLKLLELQSNKLTGTLPGSWSRLQRIESLNLGAMDEDDVTRCSGNQITGTLPASWSSMPALEELQVGCNQLTGTLPSSWGQTGFKRLRKLFLFNNKLKGQLPGNWAGMSSLTGIDLSTNSLTGTLPAEWGAMKNMEELHLFENQISGQLPGSWAGMSRLQTLNLGMMRWDDPTNTKCGGNLLTGRLPPQWAALRALQNLTLACNRLSGQLPGEWGTMHGLVSLYAYDNALTGALPASWSGMVGMLDLDMGSNKLSGPLPSSWGAMSRAERLSLKDNELSGGLPAPWASMSRLAFLDLSGNRLSGSVPAAWGGGMKRMKELILHTNEGLSGCVPSDWEGRLEVPDGPGWPDKDVGQLWAGTGVQGFC